MLVVLLAALCASANGATYPLAKALSGTDFWAGWNWIVAPDNTTNGNVTYVDYGYASQHGMAEVNPTGQVVLGVDRSVYVQQGASRNSFRIESQEQYGVGSVLVLDATHMPFGCGVWASFWQTGEDWPDNGEIDIFEGVNLQATNSMTLHTANNSGCLLPMNTYQLGATIPNNLNCSTIEKVQPEGCAIKDLDPTSYGQAFAQSGGGVYAAELAASGVYMWYWGRGNVPAELLNNASSIDTSKWGQPAANFSLASSTCNVPKQFGYQKTVLDITLCGDYAGSPIVYPQTCAQVAGGWCYNNVWGDGSNLQDAYFAINSVKWFSSNISEPSTLGLSPSASMSAVGALAAIPTNEPTKNSAMRAGVSIAGALVVGALAVLSTM